jgi:hypothetical protein
VVPDEPAAFSSYNIANVVHLRGPLDVAALTWSLNEIVKRHRAYRTGHESPLPRLAIQYADFAVWRYKRSRESRFAVSEMNAVCE